MFSWRFLEDTVTTDIFYTEQNLFF